MNKWLPVLKMCTCFSLLSSSSRGLGDDGVGQWAYSGSQASFFSGLVVQGGNVCTEQGPMPRYHGSLGYLEC